MNLNQVQKDYILHALEHKQINYLVNSYFNVKKFANSIGISETELKTLIANLGITVGEMKIFDLMYTEMTEEQVEKYYSNKKNTDRTGTIKDFNSLHALVLFINKKLGIYFMYQDIRRIKNKNENYSFREKNRVNVSRKMLIDIIRDNNLEDELCNTFAEFIEVPIYDIKNKYGLKEKFPDKKIDGILEDLEQVGVIKSFKYSSWNQKMYSIESLGYKNGELQKIWEDDYTSNSYHIKIEMGNFSQINHIISQLSQIFNITNTYKRHSMKKNNYTISFAINPYKDLVKSNKINSGFINEKTATIMIENAELSNTINRIEANVKETKEYQTIQNKLIGLLKFKREHKDDNRTIRELENKVKELENELKKTHAGGRPPSITKQQEKEIKKLSDKGYSIREIVNRCSFRVSVGAVHKLVSEQKSKKNS